MKKAHIHKFFEILHAANPEPKGELEYVNPYTLLVAVVLSAQATDKGVNKATKPLFAKINTPAKMIKLGEAGLKEYIKTIGLYNAKAKNVIALSEILVRDYKGEIPTTRDELVKLPGVGRKTANVVLNIAFGQETMAVDTHIFRISNRTGLAPGSNVDKVEIKLEEVVPKEFRRHAHHWLILHGRYTCKARNPLCSECPVYGVCEFKEKAEISGKQKASA